MINLVQGMVDLFILFNDGAGRNGVFVYKSVEAVSEHLLHAQRHLRQRNIGLQLRLFI